MDAVRRHVGGDAPPILTLLDLFDRHRGAFEHDWRTRFGIAFAEPGDMSWGEVWRLTNILAADPQTWVAAAVNGWDRPFTWEWAAQMDHLDFLALARWADAGKKGSRPKPLSRPWKARNPNRRLIRRFGAHDPGG